MSFADAARGWLLLEIQGSSAFSGGNMFTTSDGGETWSTLPQPSVGGSIRFFPDGTGWLSGGVHHNELYRTNDGGHTWAQVVLPLPKQVQPYTVVGGDGKPYVMPTKYTGPYFSTEQNGTMLVSVPISKQKAPLLTYVTEDGGDTWELRKTDLSPHMYGPFAFFDSSYMKLGMPQGAPSGILAIQSESAGSAEPIRTHLPNKHAAVAKADFLDPLNGWLLMTDSSLLGTSDGGKHWIFCCRGI